MRQDEIVVYTCCTQSRWMEKEYQKAKLQEIIEWNELKNNSGKLIDNVECAKADPVC